MISLSRSLTFNFNDFINFYIFWSLSWSKEVKLCLHTFWTEFLQLSSKEVRRCSHETGGGGHDCRRQNGILSVWILRRARHVVGCYGQTLFQALHHWRGRRLHLWCRSVYLWGKFKLFFLLFSSWPLFFLAIFINLWGMQIIFWKFWLLPPYLIHN